MNEPWFPSSICSLIGAQKYQQIQYSEKDAAVEAYSRSHGHRKENNLLYLEVGMRKEG